ncbi:hypothetical protein Droror1_Dr00023448 [Drosera rotundifolia]
MRKTLLNSLPLANNLSQNPNFPKDKFISQMAPFISIQAGLAIDFAALSRTSREFAGILELIKNLGIELLLNVVCRISYSRAIEFLDNGVLQKDRDEFVTTVDGVEMIVSTDSI